MSVREEAKRHQDALLDYYSSKSGRPRSSFHCIARTEREHWIRRYEASLVTVVQGEGVANYPLTVSKSEGNPKPWTEPATKTNLPDSGERETKENGFVREPDAAKVNYVPVFTARGLDIVPHELIERIAEHYYQGGLKYAPNNWMRGTDHASLERNRRSAARHFVAWLNGETDEDHLAAVTWNMITYELNQAAGDPA